MFDRDGDRTKGFADALSIDLEKRKGSDISHRFEVHPLALFPKKWSMKITMESAQKEGLDLSKNSYGADTHRDTSISSRDLIGFDLSKDVGRRRSEKNVVVPSKDLIGFDLSKDVGRRRSEKNAVVPSKDLIGLDLSPIHHNPLDLNNFKVRPNRRRSPLAPSTRSGTRYGSEERKLSPERKYLPFIFLFSAIFAYVYIIIRVQLEVDLPEFFPMQVSNVNLLLALCMVMLLTILSNQVWRMYLIKTYRRKMGNGGQERQ